MDCRVSCLDQFKKSLLENYSKYFDDLLSGERSLPFGLLVFHLKTNKQKLEKHHINGSQTRSVCTRKKTIMDFQEAVLACDIKSDK